MKTEQTQLVVIDPKEFGLEEKQAEKMTSGLSIVIEERKALESIYSELILKELNPETLKEAKALRIKIKDNRTKGIEPWHTANKAFYLAGGRFVDAWKNKEIVVNQQMEAKLEEIEKHFENLEIARLNQLHADRAALLEPYGEVNRFIDLKQMDEVTFNNFLADTKLAYETRRENERKAEEQRIADEKKAHEERLAKEEADRLETERVRLENEELKRIADEKEKLRKERAVLLQPYIVFIRDYDALISSENFDNELAEIKKGAELQWEHDFQEQKKANALKAKQEEEIRLAKIDKDKKDAELALIKKELDAERERKEKDLADEKSRIEAEESEKLAKEKAALLAPDKDKINALYLSIKNISFPELQTEEAIAISVSVKEGLDIILLGIKNAASTLK